MKKEFMSRAKEKKGSPIVKGKTADENANKNGKFIYILLTISIANNMCNKND